MSEGGPGAPASVRTQAGQALIALAEIAQAAWSDPQFVRRQRHGDPSALAELRARACTRVGVNPAAIEALLRQDDALKLLWEQTVEQARATATEGGGRSITVILLMAAGAVALCIIAWFMITYYQGQAATRRAPEPAAQPTR